MPRKPKKPCSFPACPALTDDRFCENHKKEYNRNYERYQRDPKTKRRYGSQWRKIRKMYLNRHPMCEECQKQGRVTKANEVHHILALSKGGTNHFDNLMALCKSCHSKIHAEAGDRFGKNIFREGEVTSLQRSPWITVPPFYAQKFEIKGGINGLTEIFDFAQGQMSLVSYL